MIRQVGPSQVETGNMVYKKLLEVAQELSIKHHKRIFVRRSTEALPVYALSVAVLGDGTFFFDNHRYSDQVEVVLVTIDFNAQKPVVFCFKSTEDSSDEWTRVLCQPDEIQNPLDSVGGHVEHFLTAK